MKVSNRVKQFLAAAGVATALSAGGAQASVVFTETFETPQNTRNWQVYQNFGGWSSTSGRGIEIQRSGVVVQAHSGNQYVELDSDRRRGGASSGSSNSAMTTMLNLTAGVYELEYFYRPRTNRLNDNLIKVFLDGASDALQTNQIGSSDGRRGQINHWVRQTITFAVDGTDNNYGLTFAAGGRANTLGGFIDTITLRNVPAPAPIGMLGLGILGLAAFGRRSRKA